MKRFVLLALALVLALPAFATFRVGYGERDITPVEPMPMWGYAARRDALSEGVLDPLYAKAVVIDVGDDKLALVGLDLGRGPTEAMMGEIRAAVKAASGVNWVLISGSHTHHGPVIELLDEPDRGQGKFDYAVTYAKELPGKIIEAINEAAASTVDGRIGWGSRDTDLNRNRHTKKTPKPRDPELAVVRFDDLEGNPIAVMVNFAAHPTVHKMMDLRFTSEWPGHMQASVEDRMATHCFFMQGAAGDMSANTSDERRGIDGFGKAMADVVIEIARGIETREPEQPGVRGM
ncbi:MAG TPA: neutral/alkaline non-lysosomal ceramidase N-terminal domain-containing protein, partial [Candidatus Hydrogenedentes bacterium]|nr:neutral/alkaline non-lysosomal ceramidase N-terminal domain-containing protein [Candidatus Hydrogenedentota bacterium]